MFLYSVAFWNSGFIVAVFSVLQSVVNKPGEPMGLAKAENTHEKTPG